MKTFFQQPTEMSDELFVTLNNALEQCGTTFEPADVQTAIDWITNDDYPEDLPPSAVPAYWFLDGCCTVWCNAN
jgi:hypothetical protein